MIKNFLIKIIRLYQKTLSPDHGIIKDKYPGGFCRYRPSCSDYSVLALKKHGIFKGIYKSAWRILRCNPWIKGGLDLP